MKDSSSIAMKDSLPAAVKTQSDDDISTIPLPGNSHDDISTIPCYHGNSQLALHDIPLPGENKLAQQSLPTCDKDSREKTETKDVELEVKEDDDAKNHEVSESEEETDCKQDSIAKTSDEGAVLSRKSKVSRSSYGQWTEVKKEM